MATLVQAKPAGSKFNTKKVLLTFVIAGIVLLVLIGLIFWYVAGLTKFANNNAIPVVQNEKKASASAQVATNTALPKTLKTFTGVLFDSTFDGKNTVKAGHNYAIKYPSDWTAAANDGLNKNNGHYVTFTSPNAFSLVVKETPGGVGGNCDGNVAPADLIVSSDKITVNGQALFMVFVGSKAKNEVQKAYLDSDPAVYCDGMVALKTKNADTNFTAEMSFAAAVSKDDFINSNDYQMAKDILISLVFAN